MSSIVFAITFLCLFFAAVIGFVAGLLIRSYATPRTRVGGGAGEADTRTLRLMEVSAAEARKELAELRATVQGLRSSVEELGVPESLKKLALLDAMWNKLGLLEVISGRVGPIEHKIALVEPILAKLDALDGLQKLDPLAERLGILEGKLDGLGEKMGPLAPHAAVTSVAWTHEALETKLVGLPTAAPTASVPLPEPQPPPSRSPSQRPRKKT